MRRRLEPGFVVTVEPGCYFVSQLLEPALLDPETAKYINRSVLDRYRSLGGVRIEDVVLVTADGYENLVSAPKLIAEIEAVMAI
jgi:Xaa-Pro dipeptidase